MESLKMYNKKSLNNLNRTTHGMSGSRFYRIYYGIHNRCNNIKNQNYPRYGGKGIRNERNSFDDFKDDMYESYIKLSNEIGENNVSIERIDNNKNYNKENCEWIHISRQQANRNFNHYITILGEKKTIAQTSRELGLLESTLRQRVLRGSKDVFGKVKKPMKIKYEGKRYGIKELENVVEFSRRTIYRKIERGGLPIRKD